MLYKGGDGAAGVTEPQPPASASRIPTTRFIRHSPHASSPPHLSSFLPSPTPRHSHTPSHPHITLQDVSHHPHPHPHPSLSSSSPHLPLHSRPDASLSNSLTLPPHSSHHHHRGGVKSHSADFHASSPSSSSSLPHSPSRTHSPRNNGVVHLSAAALEFSPTLPSSIPSSPARPPSQLSAAPTSPHSARSTSSTSSSSSSSSHQPRALSRQSSQGRASTATTTTSLPSSSSLSSSALSPPPSSTSSSIPLCPCDDFDVTLNLSAEQPAHLSYLLSFRTSVCSHWASLGPSQCGCVSAACFASHSNRPRRRRPTLLNGRYNYLPTRCRYVRGGNGGCDAEDECPQGVHCRFAHCTEEVIYHPSKYKTQLCQHRTDEDGACLGYGLHCAKAHSQSDLRVGVYEVSDDSPTPLYSPSEHLHHFQCPPSEHAQERLYYAHRYKTKRCDGFPYNCSCNGFDFHREEERRRGPVILYAPIACPNVKATPHSEWGYPSVDCSGRHRPRVLEGGVWKAQRCDVWECEYAHTLLELMYHPAVYKTGQCDKWEEKDTRRWKCVWKRRCAHAHGRGDARSKDEAMDEWKEHIRTHTPAAALHSTLARLLHPQGPNAANAANGPVAFHAASTPLPSIGDGNGGVRAVLGHSRSVSQPMMDVQRVSAPVHPPPHPSNPSPRQVHPARSTSQNILPNPAGPSPPSAYTSFLAPHDRLSPRPLRIVPTQPLPSSHPHTPTSATSSTSLSLFNLHSNTTDPSSSLWSSPAPHSLSSSSPSHPDSSSAAWTSSRSTPPPPPPSKHHRRSVTADATTASNLHSLFSTFPTHHPPATFPHPSLTLHMPQPPSHPSSSSSSSSSPTSSASPSHLVPKNLFSSTSSLQSSVGGSLATSPRGEGGAGGVAGGDGEGGGVRVRLVSKAGMVGEDVDEVKAKGHRLVRWCEEWERSGALPITLRYLSCAETGEGVVVAHAGEGAVPSVYSALQSSASPLLPLPLIQQLFAAVSALHASSIEHGAISPFTVLLASTPNPHLRLGDVRWRRVTAGAREQERDDVFACACVAYFLLSSGRSPFSASSSSPPLSHSEWMEGRLQYPVDTSCLSPLASHLLLPLLFSDASSRLTAAQVTAHPLFWSASHALHFLYVLSCFLRPSVQPRAAVELPHSYIGVEEVQVFLLECARSEPRLASSASWVDALHPLLRGLAVSKGSNGRSAVAALHFVADCVDLLAGLAGTAVPSELQSLFHLPQQAHPGSDDGAPVAVRYQHASSACASYFLPLFPHLLPFLFQRVEARLMAEAAFQPFTSPEDGSRPFVKTDPARSASPRWAQLRELMLCPMGGRGTGGESGPHLLHRPVTLPCCGMALCAGCLPEYAACVDGRPCQCGNTVGERERQQLLALPVHALLQAITALLPH